MRDLTFVYGFILGLISAMLLGMIAALAVITAQLRADWAAQNNLNNRDIEADDASIDNSGHDVSDLDLNTTVIHRRHLRPARVPSPSASEVAIAEEQLDLLAEHRHVPNSEAASPSTITSTSGPATPRLPGHSNEASESRLAIANE